MPRYLITAFALLVLAAPAQARPDRVIRSLAQAGPVLSGGSGTVSWVTGRRQGPLEVVTARRGGPKPVADLPQAQRRVTFKSALDHFLTMDGDPDGRISVHLLTREYSVQKGGSQRTAGQVLLAGTATGPLERITGCMDGEDYCLPRECIYGAGALSPFGTLSLEVAPGTGGGFQCFEQQPRLVSRGLEWSLPVAPALGARIATAGRYIAIAESPVPLTAYCPQEQPLDARDAPDGQVFVNGGICGPFDVTAGGYLVRLLENRIEWDRIERPGPTVRRRVEGRDVAASGRRALVGTATKLVLISRNGGRRTVARFNEAWKRIGGIDFDGRRVAWAERRCGAPRVVVTRVDRPRRDPPARCG